MDCQLEQQQDGRHYCRRCGRSLLRPARRACTKGAGDRLRAVLAARGLAVEWTCKHRDELLLAMNEWGNELCRGKYWRGILDYVERLATTAHRADVCLDAEQILDDVLGGTL